MKRLLIYLGLVLSLASASAQEFLTNEDFIFGVGDTDSAAVIALSTSIRVAVTSDITYSVRETKKTISEDFSKNIGLSSSIIITNSRQYIDKNGKYYRYINKKEYLTSKKSDYNKLFNLAISIDKSGVKHEINQILGYYYLAYTIMDEPLMMALCPEESAMLKADIINRAERIYCSKTYGLLVADEKTPGGYYIRLSGGRRDMNESEPATLYGFRYQDGNDWVFPKYYYNSIIKKKTGLSDNDYDMTINRVCRIISNTPRLHYRITYETVYNGRLVEISVPEEWYFKDLVVLNTRNLN